MISTLLGTTRSASVLIILCVLFFPLEAAFGHSGATIFRAGWLTDLLVLSLGPYVLCSAVVFWIMILFSGCLATWIPLSFRTAVRPRSIGGPGSGSRRLSISYIYWGHRCSHRVGFLVAISIRFITAPEQSDGWPPMAKPSGRSYLYRPTG